MRYPFVWLSICLIMGICLSFIIDIILLWLFLALACCLVSAVFFYRYSRYKLLFYFCIAIALSLVGILSTHIENSTYDKIDIQSYSKSTIIVQGIIRSQLKDTKKYHRYIIETDTIDGFSTRLLLMAFITKEAKNISFDTGDYLIAALTLSPIPKATNPHQFDYRDYLSRRHIYLNTYIQRDTPMRLIQSDNNSLSIFSQKIRQRIVKSLEHADISPSNIGVIRALFLGDRTEISTETSNDFRDAGIIHILAVSGLHVAIIYFLILFSLRPLQWWIRNKLFINIIAIILLWSYAVLVDFTPSVTRAVTMFSFYALAKGLGRTSSSVNVLFCAMFFTLLFSPYMLYEIGFQLSYAAVAAIIIFKPLIDKLWSPKYFFIRKLWDIITISIIAQLGVLPLILFYFHQFSGLFLISNLLIMIFIEPFMAFGFLAIFLSLLGWIPTWVFSVFDWATHLLQYVAHEVASYHSLVFRFISFDWWTMIMVGISIISLYFLIKYFNARALFYTILSVSLIQFSYLLTLFIHQGQHRLVIFNLYNHSLAAYQSGLSLYSFSEGNSKYAQRLLSEYATAEYIHWQEDFPLKNIIDTGNYRIYCLDSSAIYQLPLSNHSVDILWIRQSPKINMDRVLARLRPIWVIADGSNYNSLKKKWKSSCEYYDIKFYDTTSSGAFVKEFN